MLKSLTNLLFKKYKFILIDFLLDILLDFIKDAIDDFKKSRKTEPRKIGK